MSELAKEMARRSIIGSFRFFDGGEGSQVNTVAIDTYPSYIHDPTIGTAQLAHSLHAATVIFWETLVASVFSMRGTAQIVKTIICAFAIFMVDLVGSFVHHHTPNQSVRFVANIIDTDVYVTSGMDAASRLVRKTSVPSQESSVRSKVACRSELPRQYARCRIITQALAQIFLGWETFYSHLCSPIASVVRVVSAPQMSAQPAI